MVLWYVYLIYANLTFLASLKLLKIVSFSRSVIVESVKQIYHSYFPLISALSVTSSSNLFISLNLAFSLFLSLLTSFNQRNRCFEDIYHYIVQLRIWGNKNVFFFQNFKIKSSFLLFVFVYSIDMLITELRIINIL